MLAFLRSISARHTALKERIHAFRIPLPPAGQKFMGLVYFTIPVIGGYNIMQWAIGQSEANLGVQGEKLDTSSEADRHRQQSKRVLQGILSKKSESESSSS